MIIAHVVGTVVATRKSSQLTGSKFMIVEPIDGPIARMVAVDSVGAGIGDIVLVAMGSAARADAMYENSPIDALIVGIVDDPSKIVIEKV